MEFQWIGSPDASLGRETGRMAMKYTITIDVDQLALLISALQGHNDPHDADDRHDLTAMLFDAKPDGIINDFTA
jgi:hypothetical protein